MPELPEVETVRRGLAPVMEGFVFERVTLNRPDLRFPFHPEFVARVQGQKLEHLTRRAKFMIGELTSGDRIFLHLGMSGRFTIDENVQGQFVHQHDTNPKHDHVHFVMSSGSRVTYNDPRRFGFMELIAPGEATRIDHLGPEPLSNELSGPTLRAALKSKKANIKSALLDQRVIAGLGNIYVCEALYRAKISPRRMAGRLKITETETLTRHIKDVIAEAIEAGGSSLRDFANTEGGLGYFQHTFDVYGRENQACKICHNPIFRLVQSGRSTFYCKICQR